MGNTEPSMITEKLWNDFKNSPDTIKENAKNLYPLCKNWDNFVDAINSSEMRSKLSESPHTFFSLASYVMSL